jgi:hypothetical protein
MKRAILWPKLDNSDVCSDWACRLLWFLGHKFDSIAIINDSFDEASFCIPQYASVSVINELHKLKVFSDYSNVGIENGDFEDVYFVWDKCSEPPKDILFEAVKGSQRIAKFDRNNGRGKSKYYYVGSQKDADDAYLMIVFSYWYENHDQDVLLRSSEQKLSKLKEKIAKLDTKVNLYGTGPSLAESELKGGENGINFICNTIVKNRPFLDSLRPTLIAASDAHFHFSYHRYSSALLSDLIWTLRKYNGLFVTFDKFAPFIVAKVPEIAKYIVALPVSKVANNYDMKQEFGVLPAESVVNMFMLPVAMYLDKDVTMSGFTGRAPNDKYFWAHSETNQYSSLLADVRSAHPMFFENRDYENYNDKVDEQINQRILFMKHNKQNVYAATTSFYKALN